METIKLINNDWRNVFNDIDDNSIDLIVTDPPYDYEYKFTEGNGGSVNDVKGFDKSLKKLNNINPVSYNIGEFCSEAIRVMKNINIYIWCNKSQIYEYLSIFVGKYKCKYEIIVWNKIDALPTYYNKYLTDCEYCLYFHKGVSVHPGNYEDAKTVYIGKINRESKLYGHPTVKPLELTKKMISNSSKEGDLVLDPFMGSGTSGVACRELGRKFIGIEINNEYFNICKTRISGIDPITMQPKVFKMSLFEDG